MCDHETPCDPARLVDRAAQGHHCAWTGTLWLAAGWDHPVVLRDASARVAAVVQASDGAVRGGVVNSTTHVTESWMPWQDGSSWWRAEEERVRVSVPLPCDARHLGLTLNVEGRTMGGDVAGTSQSAEVSFRSAQPQ